MLTNRFTIISLITIILLSFTITTISFEVPFPGPPHEFYGTVKDIDGNNLPDDTEIKALIQNEVYTTNVKNGKYGFNEPYYPPLESDPSPYFVEDPSFDNEGKIVYFHVNGINTSQKVTFINGGLTRLDLIVNLNSGNGGNNGGGTNGGNLPSNGDSPSTQLPPVADPKGPYRGRVNQSIVFYGSDSYDLDGSIVNYTWDFGDNSRSYEINPSHIYLTEGVFIVTLTVMDNDNLTSKNTTTAKIFFDSDGDGWSDDEEENYGYNSSDPYDFPPDNDGDYIPDEYDDDDDNDGLTDEEEINLNLDPKKASDVKKITSAYGVFFFVDVGSDGIPDIYYNKTNGLNTTLVLFEYTKYFVDIDGDGNWDYIYDYLNSSIDRYKLDKEYSINPIILAIIIIVLIFVIIFSIYYRKIRGGGK